MKSWVRNHQLLSFFTISYTIMFGSLFGYMALKPDQPMQSWSLVWFLSVFSPTYSAVIVSWAIGGVEEVKHLLSGFLRWKVGSFWYLAAGFLLIGPLVISFVFILLGNPATGLRVGWTVPLLLMQVVTQFFAGPASEEAGWRGFALPRLQVRYNALASSLILGVIWTCWHLPLFFLTGQTQVSIPFPIYLVLVTTVTVYLTWLYNNTRGSLIVTTLAHFSYNLTGTLITGPMSLMPAMTFYLTAGPLLFLLTVVVVILYGSRHLSKKTAAELPVPIESSPAPIAAHS